MKPNGGSAGIDQSRREKLISQMSNVLALAMLKAKTEERKVAGDERTKKRQELKELIKERVLSYEEAFAKIEEATGVKDVDKLVENFIQAEERNFKMFKFVNGQSEEIEALENQISSSQSEIDMMRDSSEAH